MTAPFLLLSLQNFRLNVLDNGTYPKSILKEIYSSVMITKDFYIDLANIALLGT